jgi:muramidase (phage lysozyme)
MAKKNPAYYQSILKNPNVQAYLQTIRNGEGTLGPEGYRMIVGKSKFNDFSDHPHIYVKKYNSTAAGAYQFIYGTWNEIKKVLTLKDFSPYSQDIAAVYKLDQTKALEDVLNGDIVSAINKTKSTWVSLPGGPHDAVNKHSQSLPDALQFYQSHGGILSSKDQKIKSGSTDQRERKPAQRAFNRSDKLSSIADHNSNIVTFLEKSTGQNFEHLPYKPDKQKRSTSKKKAEDDGVIPPDSDCVIRINRNSPLIGNFVINTEQVTDERNNFQRKMEEALLEILDR